MASLLARSIAGFLFLIAVLALVLFVASGTLAYWQAWSFLAVFSACVILITGYLARRDPHLLAGRVRAGPVAERDPAQKVLQSLAAACFLLLFVVPALDHRHGWSHVPPVAVLIADAMVVLGLLLVFRVFRENTYASATIQVEAEQKVITTGPYAVVRHPMYAGALLMCLFAPMALGSWIGIAAVLPLAAVIAVRMLWEERVLMTGLPGYAAYAQSVRYRLIPFLW